MLQFSPDGNDIAIAFSSSPYISAYKWSSGIDTKYSDPSLYPSSYGRFVTFSPDGNYIAISHDGSPAVHVYPWSSSTGFGTKYTNPSSSIAGDGNEVAFSPDGNYIAIANGNYPYPRVFGWSSSGFGTSVTFSGSLPSYTRGISFSPNGNFIAIAHAGSPYVSVYPWSSGFGTKYADPGTLPAYTGIRARFSPDGNDIAVTITILQMFQSILGLLVLGLNIIIQVLYLEIIHLDWLLLMGVRQLIFLYLLRLFHQLFPYQLQQLQQ
jgi:WD40 repeat protein